MSNFVVGSQVQKKKGYAFDSEVRAVFTNKNGDTRLVCESTVIPGMLHIFSPEQMQLSTSQEDDVRE